MRGFSAEARGLALVLPAVLETKGPSRSNMVRDGVGHEWRLHFCGDRSSGASFPSNYSVTSGA
jgi:hypothetical protein